ncbi:MAG: hypothetical protein GY743_23630 [Planctomycetaceae bacterium]|nr:hypothetical protein [Planctomycetaceae bacterium]
MADNGIIQVSAEQSAQSRFTDDPEEVGVGIASVLTGLIRAGELLPPWWSQRRDLDLYRFFMQSDHLQAAEYKMRTKLTAITPHVVPRDSNIKSSIALANDYNALLYESWEMGQGWQVGFGKDITDFLTRDNGFFREITGPGRKDGPIKGMPTGSASLDPTRCTRTNSPEFPVLYTDTDGQRYKFHHSRVMFSAQSPSSLATMRGVGRCWITRAVNTAQNLIDILLYKQEKLGSRPLRQMLIGKGITAEQLWGAVIDAEEGMDDAGLRRFGKTVVVGSQSTDVDVHQIDLANVPDGFDERTSIEIGMFAIALAAGIPPRDLWPASTTGATRADAETQHVSGSAGYQSILDLFAFLIGGSPLGNRQSIRGKFLPPSLRLVFDFIDDEQDARAAQNASIRAGTRERDIADKVVSIRVAREQALEASDITQTQFEDLELNDGRLPDGQSVLNLFLTTDPAMQELLSISVPNPLDVDANQENVEFVLEQIKDALLLANMQALNASTTRIKSQAKQAVRALTELQRIYQPDEAEDEEEEADEADGENPVSDAIEEDQEEV